ncbi:MAG: alpha/beta hydrolase [Flavobacteriales bacterium]|nr:alpha/beta hydrolase [Flavobacteriales bacterium]
MIRKFLLCVALLPIFGFSQITIKITSIPDNTPKEDKIYLVGNVNDWNPQDANYQLRPDQQGNLSIQIPEGITDLEFKFTRGSWESTEGNASGKYLHNRVSQFTGSNQVLEVSIESWEDLAGEMKKTFADNVSVLRESFYMPQLNRFRKIWVYLPPDYYDTTKNYPVLYMQDGQNLFDNTTSYAGEWSVDETLNELHKNGDYGAIVIGIANGNQDRNKEYSPWKNVTYSGGEGNDYLQFIVETLKPHVDSKYRTLKDPDNTALIGSSLGALISTYGACKYPSIFGKVGALSPAYWFSFNELNKYLETLPKKSLKNLKLYVVAGQDEYEMMVSDVEIVKANLEKKGVQKENIKVKFDADGTHTEYYWKREFGSLYQWLFAPSEKK